MFTFHFTSKLLKYTKSYKKSVNFSFVIYQLLGELNVKNKFIHLYNNTNHTLFMLIIIAIIVPVAGELKLYPFNENFRISFGMPSFFFLLLIWRRNKALFAGVIAGITVVFFRTLIDLPDADFNSSFIRHYPTFFYYLTFGTLYQFIKVKKILHRPLIVGLIGVLLDIIASLAELTAQFLVFSSFAQFDNMYNILIIAIFRSFSTVGLYNLIILRHTRLKNEQIKNQNQKLILLITELYEETLNLNKTLVNSENITEKSYNLYQTLKNSKDSDLTSLQNNLAKDALEIAGESHEIKKDNERILAGLSKLISNESFSKYMTLDTIIQIAISSNKNYAHALNKEITFSHEVADKTNTYHVYMTLSIINNLVTNAIEAIDTIGTIHINLINSNKKLIIEISDNGPGIKDAHTDIIFEPGFTTKYDQNGNASTGIGLSYVYSLVTKLDGDISIQHSSDLNGLTFIIKIPIKNLTRKENR